MLTSEDRDIIATTDPETLAQWYCEFNRWGWPEVFANPETDEQRRKSPISHTRSNRIMEAIREEVGERAISHAWNVPRMTEEEFAEFWANKHKVKQLDDAQQTTA